MNYSKAVFLINKNVRAVLATYTVENNAKRTAFKTLDPDIKVDDFIIVPSDMRHEMTICKVVEVDVDLDFDASDKVHWIIGVVDRTQYSKTLQEEASAIKAIKSAELRKKRDDLRDALFSDHVEQLKALPIATLNGDHKEAAETK